MDIRFRGKAIDGLTDAETRAALRDVMKGLALLDTLLVRKGVLQDGELSCAYEEGAYKERNEVSHRLNYWRSIP